MKPGTGESAKPRSIERTVSGAEGDALLFLSFPHQLLHAFGAMRYDRSLRGIAADSPATAIVWSHHAANHRRSSVMREAFELALKGFPWVRLVFPGFMSRSIALSPYRHVTARAKALARILRGRRYEALYYAHDASADHTAQALMQAFPTGRRICFGDPPGFLFDDDGASVASPAARPLEELKRIFWASRRGAVARWFRAEASLVALDLSDGATQSAPLSVIPRELLTAVLDELKAGSPELHALQSRAIDAEAGDARRWLLVLSNFSDSGLMSEESEIALYAEICRKHVEPGGIIHVKGHAGSSRGLLAKLAKALVGYRLTLLPHELQVAPLEFCDLLVSRCTVLSVSSGSLLLEHLYGGLSITHALTDEQIRKYFYGEHALAVMESNRTVRARLSRGDASSSSGEGGAE